PCKLFVMIVLGESIALTGATASATGLDRPVGVALALAFGSSVALWWIYFGNTATSDVREVTATEAPGQVGRDAYTYLHIPIVAGILLTAAADGVISAHPPEDMGTAGALVALGGVALYLIGVVAFGARVGRHQPWTRAAGAAVLLAAIPAAASLPGLAVAGFVTALLALLVVADSLGVGHRPAE